MLCRQTLVLGLNWYKTPQNNQGFGVCVKPMDDSLKEKPKGLQFETNIVILTSAILFLSVLRRPLGPLALKKKKKRE
jgi:hypothetical protein